MLRLYHGLVRMLFGEWAVRFIHHCSRVRGMVHTLIRIRRCKLYLWLGYEWFNLKRLVNVRVGLLWSSFCRHIGTILKQLVMIMSLLCRAYVVRFTTELCRCFRDARLWSMKRWIVALTYPWMTKSCSNSSGFCYVSTVECHNVLFVFGIEQVCWLMRDYCAIAMINQFL